MLVQCDLYEVDGKVLADIYCERCGEACAMQVPRQVVTDLVNGNVPVICADCQETRCKTCQKYPTKNHVYGSWVNGVCWECRDAYYAKLLGEVRELLLSEPPRY